MNQLRLDPLSGRWVAISTERLERGSAFITRQTGFSDRDTCPFCPGHEEQTPPALETYGSEGHWVVRVVPNRYPAFSGTQPFVVEHRGPVFTEAPASGIHEVLVLSPDHDLPWSAFTDEHCALVMAAIRNRIEEHQSTPGLRYTQVIMNVGREAGASIEHPHGQLLGIPFVPRELVDEQGSFTRFAGGCLLCTAASAEERAGYRLVEATDDFVIFSPFWASTAYEMLIVPRAHEPHLHQADPDSLSGMGRAVRDALAALQHELGDVPYNVVFHAAPYRAGGPFHWHIHILPKLTTRAGFELGTGVEVNLVAPELAAAELRSGIEKARAVHPEANVAS